MGSEKFCLSWNDFESNISLSFRELREEKDFFDITLSCGDEQIQAHKLILSACSPFFRSVLKKNVHQHPLLYLKGVKFRDLQAVLNFMYHGEVNVAQEELNSFLAVAEDLKVKGLTQNNQSGQKSPGTPPYALPKQNPRPPPDRDPVPAHKKALKPLAIPANKHDDEIQEVVPVKTEPREVPPQVPSRQQDLYSQEVQPTGSQEISRMDENLVYPQEDSYEEFGGYEADQGFEGGNVDTGIIQGQDPSKGLGRDPEELLVYVTENTDLNSDMKWMCKICGKAGLNRRDIRNHVESLHFPDTFAYQCKICFMTMKSRKALDNHKYRKHPKDQQF